MEQLTHSLDRSIVIQARPETVFQFFTDSARWAAWWGAGSAIDARAGGKMAIRYPDGTEVSGDVIEVVVSRRIVFTYGYASGKPIAPGASRVTIHLEPHARGTELRLTHEFAEAAVRDLHIQGWRFQLSLFANLVAEEVNAGAAGVADGWFAAWSVGDENARAEALARLVSPEIRFGDRYSAIAGLSELVAHIGAAQRFMPQMRMERRGPIRHCQGVVLADWAAVGGDGAERAKGTNVFLFGANGLIDSVTGFWS